jgi:macrolide transport system ATP-binding/permease protein
MSILITNISKSYGIHQILDNASLVVSGGQRIGLVGANGVGKSTLLKIIVGEIEPDGGTITIANQVRIGYLPQAMIDFGTKTIDDLVAEAVRDLQTLEERMRSLERQMTETGANLETIMAEYGQVAEQFEQHGGYELAHRVDSILTGLRVGHIARQRQIATLSGGERSRVGLAMLLLQVPDVLLLDEPTNHLDFASLEWLESYLQGYRGAMLIVSHDRQFLNRAATSIVEIEEHSQKARQYTGNYDAYLEAKTLERQRWQFDYERQQEEIKALRHEIKTTARQVSHNRAPKDGDKFLKGFKRGRVENTVSRRVSSAEERLRRIEADPIPKPPDDLNFEPDFDPQTIKGHTPLFVSGLVKAFGRQTVLDGVSFTLGLRSRIALVGANGTGKSTLLKILAGLLPIDEGEIYINPQVKIGYLDQDQESLQPGRTVLETYSADLPGHAQQHITALLASGLFRYEEVGRQVGQLSSGQKRKLQIARLMAERANLLLLDEPTNYVSFDVLEAFEAALRAFPGPVVAASHDRRFLEQFGGEVWELRDGHLIRHMDGLEGYRAAASGVALRL